MTERLNLTIGGLYTAVSGSRFWCVSDTTVMKFVDGAFKFDKIQQFDWLYNDLRTTTDSLAEAREWVMSQT